MRSPSLTAFAFDRSRASWRIVAGRVLVVSRASGRLHRLDRLGTQIWQVLAAAAPAPLEVEAVCDAIADSQTAAPPADGDVELFLCDLELAGLLSSAASALATAPASRDAALEPARDRERSMPTGRASRPRQRRLTGAWELVDEIAPGARTLACRVGAGFLLRAPDGELEVVSGAAASVWGLLSSEPRTFVELLDALGERDGSVADDGETLLATLLLSWHDRGVVAGLERVDGLRARLETATAASCVRSLGRLEATHLSGPVSPPPRLGSPPAPLDAAAPIEHVAVVCQYGIQDLAPGVEPYTQRCIARLRRLDVDLVILAGGGRHGGSDLREAESVIDRYRTLLPDRPLWVEKHSGTTWENLQLSLEMLAARGTVPRRISFVGDRARVEKLRVACWIAKRRFAPFRRVSFRVVPVPRPRFTWRDSRTVQLVVGSAQVIKESRRQRLAVGGAPV